MAIRNIEIKCRHNSPGEVEKLLIELGAKYIGKDRQVDTYFNTLKGRLKLREGEIENNLIFYDRIENKDLKDSKISLFPVKQGAQKLRDVLSRSHGVKKVISKERKIFFIDNVKFHIDKVEGLGSFIEIEAIDEDETLSLDNLKAQCEKYIAILKLDHNDFIDQSYSDMDIK